MWFVPENTDPFNDKESAIEAALEVAKRTNEKTDIYYLNYDAEGAPDTVKRAHPCGCVENAPGQRRFGQWAVQCDEHKEK